MNTSEWEQQMKHLLEDQEYHPEDTAWQKMQEALHPSAPATTRFLPLLFPVWKKAAAAAVLLALCGTSYLLLHRQVHAPGPAATVAGNPVIGKQEMHQAPAPGISAVQTPAAGLPASRHMATQTASAMHHNVIPETAPIAIIQQEAQQDKPVVREETAPTPAPSSVVPANHPSKQERIQNIAYYPYTGPEYKETSKKALNIGVAANVGKPNLGDVQYAVGIVARKQLSERIFAEANVSLAATQVNYSRHFPGSGGYTGDGMGSGMPGNTSGPNERGGLSINYASNVMAVGVAPSIGVNATKHIALSVGADVYKTLNRDLNIKTDLASVGVQDASKVPGLRVSDLDAGVKAQLDYRFGQKLSLSTLYRQGLTPYIIIDGKTTKNSSFNIGLKYYIGR